MRKSLTNILIGTGLFIGSLGFYSCQEKSPTEQTKETQTAISSDSAKIDFMNNLAWSLRYDVPEKSLKFLDSALTISKKINYEKGSGDALIRRGIINKNQGNYELAKKDYLDYLEIKTAEKDSIGMGAGFNNLGLAFHLQGNYEKAIENYTNALKIYSKLSDLKSMANTNNNLGMVFASQENYDKALDYYNKSLEIKKNINDSLGVSQTYNNIGIVFDKQKNYGEALKHYFNSLEIANKVEDKFQQSACFNNIGDVYKREKDFDKAFIYLQKSLRINEEIEDKEGVALNLINIGEIYKENQSFPQALKNLENSLSIAQEIGNKKLLKEVYESMSKTYETKAKTNKDFGDAVQALNYHKNFTEIKDSLSGVEKSKQVAELETKYQTEKKEQENELLRKDQELKETKISQQKKRLWTLGGASGLISLLSIGLYGLYRKNKKAKEIIEEKNKNITASIRYASNIQRATLPREQEIKRLLPESFIFYKPKDIVSGDFYWLAEKNNKTYFSVCDCTGHGVPGAFMHMTLNTLLNEAVNQKNISKPNEIFNDVRSGVMKSLKSKGELGEQKDGMDSVLCAWDSSQNTLEFACANNPLYLIRNNELIEYKADRMAVGYSERAEDFSFNKIDLEKNDLIYISSDGYQDQFGGEFADGKFGEGKKFMRKNLKKLLLSISNEPMQKQKEILEDKIKNWKGALEQCDDLLVIGVRV